MNKFFLLAAVFLIVFGLVLGGLWYFQDRPDDSDSQLAGDELTKVNGDTESGNVSVAVTLVTKNNASDVGADSYDLESQYVFYVEMNTHSVDITKDDMAKVSFLKADGKYLKAVWKQTMESVGHHRNGFLIFNKKGETKKLELTIKDVAGVSERIFSWTRGVAGIK